jgi:hypothetical protein
MITTNQAMGAREVFKKLYPTTVVGISNNPNGKGMALVVRVKTQADASKMPKQVDKVPIIYRFIG